MTILTTVHKITPEQGAALAIASSHHGVLGGSDPRVKEAVVFIVLDLEQLVITRIFGAEGVTAFTSDICQNLYDKVVGELGIK